MTDTARCIRLLDQADWPPSAVASRMRKPRFLCCYAGLAENPDRDGLRDTPRRLVKAFSEYFCGYQKDPEQILQTTFEETDGYDEMVVLRGSSVREPLRTPCGADHRPRLGRLRTAAARGRDIQARTRRRGLREAAADPGAPDRTDRKHDRSSPQTAWGRSRHQGRSSLHVESRGPQARDRPRHQQNARMLSRQRGYAAGISVDGRVRTPISSS